MKTFKTERVIGKVLGIILFLAVAIFILREIMLYFKTDDLHHGINAILMTLAYILFKK